MRQQMSDSCECHVALLTIASTEQAYWDKLVISAKSFPVNYWDKFIKKKVRQKYSETYDFDAISNLLGMEKSSLPAEEEAPSGFFNSIMNVDWRYQVPI